MLVELVEELVNRGRGMMFMVHPRRNCELNHWKFALAFDRRGSSSVWRRDIIWSFSYKTNQYRCFSWKNN